jgi:hypothetical protein
MAAYGDDTRGVGKEQQVYNDRPNLPQHDRLALPAERVLWKGSVWRHGLLSYFCCSADYYSISNRRIDHTHGCCGNEMDTLDIRRIVDLKFERSCLQMCCCRGTLIILGADETDKHLTITTWGMKELYEELREVWLQTKNNVLIDANNGR